MQQSNTIVQGSVSLGEAFAAIGILVALAITVPIVGILMIPAVALDNLARVLFADVAGARVRSPREEAAPSAAAAPGALARARA